MDCYQHLLRVAAQALFFRINIRLNEIVMFDHCIFLFLFSFQSLCEQNFTNAFFPENIQQPVEIKMWPRISLATSCHFTRLLLLDRAMSVSHSMLLLLRRSLPLKWLVIRNTKACTRNRGEIKKPVFFAALHWWCGSFFKNSAQCATFFLASYLLLQLALVVI